ncbi:hypothetical protein CEXT_99631 [Caerostris extrusa]|uniref:Uncharacterized protein n=1 Tax=Caerostris extrusa TaxID=172846 RepID=A0AAV4R9G8_CAEEX|nr:hypothetical protein CEXT_99631 [Caerostris extrusa]
MSDVTKGHPGTHRCNVSENHSLSIRASSSLGTAWEVIIVFWVIIIAVFCATKRVSPWLKSNKQSIPLLLHKINDFNHVLVYTAKRQHGDDFDPWKTLTSTTFDRSYA